MNNQKYFLYARKSTEDDDKQVMSIEAQLFEPREFASRENLEIVEKFIESKSAKKPGREMFAAMIAEIEKMDGVGILAWHPDRLARNSVDGGKVIYLVDTQKIVSLRFPTFWLCKSVDKQKPSLYSVSSPLTIVDIYSLCGTLRQREDTTT